MMSEDVWFLLLSQFGVTGLVGIGGVYYLTKNFLPTYLKEKGKNLATKEDIEEITNKVEGIKTQYANGLEELKSTLQAENSRVEREKILKKEIYMQVAESISKMHGACGSLANLDTTRQDVEAINSKEASVVAKAQVIGSIKIVKAASNFLFASSKASMDLGVIRQPLLDRKTVIEQYLEQQRISSSEISKYTDMLKELDLTGKLDQRSLNKLDKHTRLAQKNIDDLSTKIKELVEIQKQEYIEYLRRCRQYFFDISTMIVPFILAVREELDLDTEKVELERIFQNLNTHGQDYVEQFHSDVYEKSK